MSVIVTFIFVGCGFWGILFGCPGDGSTERVQLRNNADVAKVQARTNAYIEGAYAEAEAQIGVAQADAVAQTGVAQAAASADIAWANAAQAVGVAEAEAMVQVNQAWAVALIVFALGVAGIWCVIFSQMRPGGGSWTPLQGAQRPVLDPPHPAPYAMPYHAQRPEQRIDPVTWRALENEAQQRGQRLELQGSTMLLIDSGTNAIVASREIG